MEDWSDTPIYAQMMAEQARKQEIEQLRATEPVYAQMLEDKDKKEKLMNTWQQLVVDMRNAMDLPVSPAPRTLSPEEAKLHIKMIRDEFEEEFVPAFLDQDLVEMADAGVDVLVYVIGALTNAGFDIDPLFREIMRSNMSKFDPETGKAIKAGPNDPDGHPEGKVLKGPAYSPPNLAPIINTQFVFGPEDDTVYKTKRTPITLGVGGPKIGEGDIHMDHNGNVEMDGIIFDLDILPSIEGMSILGTYEEPREEEEPPVHNVGPTLELPEGWPEPQVDVMEIESIALPEASLKTVTSHMLEGVDEAWMRRGPEIINIDEIDPKPIYDEAFQKLGYLVPVEEEQTIQVIEEGPRRSTFIEFSTEENKAN